MRILSVVILPAILLFVSGEDSFSGVGSQDQKIPYKIELKKNVRNIQQINLSKLGKEIRYIPLETNPSCLISTIRQVALSEFFIFINDSQKLLQFDTNGKFIKQIGSIGRGPGEYSYISDFCIDESNKEICILSSGIVLVFSFDGKLIRSFKLPFKSPQLMLKDESSIMFHLFNMSGPASDTAYSWYITDKLGNIKSKLKNYHKRLSQPGLIVPTSPLYVFNKTAHFSEFGNDTIYFFSNEKTKPYAIFNLDNLKMETDILLNPANIKEMSAKLKDKLWVNQVNENSGFLFIKFSRGIMSDSSTYTIFNKKTYEMIILNSNGFFNDLDGGTLFWPKQFYRDDIMIDYIDAISLLKVIKSVQSGKSEKTIKNDSDQLMNLDKQISETSNPVLIILK